MDKEVVAFLIDVSIFAIIVIGHLKDKAFAFSSSLVPNPEPLVDRLVAEPRFQAEFVYFLIRPLLVLGILVKKNSGDLICFFCLEEVAFQLPRLPHRLSL